MSEPIRSLVLIGVMAAVTMLLRFLPFVLFSRNTPKPVLYLGEVLPYAIMAMLLVYCLKGVGFSEVGRWLPELISVLLVVLLHKWKHNVLLSILSGTVCYMVLVQLIFA